MDNFVEKPAKRQKGKKGKKTVVDLTENVEEGGRTKFNRADYDVLCDWLEMEGHLEVVEGTTGKTKVGGKFPTKRRAFESLADYINDHQYKGSTLVKVDWEGVRNHFLLLQKKYKDTRQVADTTRWGLVAANEKNRIHTIAAKKESMCPSNCRLDKMFGGDPNINFQENAYCTPKSRDDADYMPWAGSTKLTVDGFHDTMVGCEDGTVFLHVDDNSEVPHTELPVPPHNMQGLSMDAPVPQPNASVPLTENAPSMNNEVPNGLGINVEVDSNIDHPPVAALNNDSSPISAPSVHSAPREQHSASRASKDKAEAPNKKRPLEKGTSVTGAFAVGLESIMKSKAASVALKERTQEMYFSSSAADKALRAETTLKLLETSHKQFEFQVHNSERNFELQLQKLRVQERRIEVEEKQIQANSQRDLMQAQLQLMTSAASGGRTPADMPEWFQMLAKTSSQGSGPST